MTVRKFSGTELVIATHNKGKLEEFRPLFSLYDITLSCAEDHNLDAPEETGTTFFENSKTKAVYVAQKTGKIALADDSGLCVDALNGDPGVWSADWAGEPRDFKMAMQKVHDAIGGSADKCAAFTACLVLAWPDGHCETVEKRAEGQMIWPPRGSGGHGYDPMFQPDGYDKTYGEMPSEQKNKISHRALACQALLEKFF